MFNVALQLVANRKGQDLVEYALMAGFVAMVAGFGLPEATGSISTIFSNVTTALTAAAQGVSQSLL